MIDQKEFFDFAADVLGVPRGSAGPETAMGSIPQWDSIMHIRLTLELEERFGFQVPLEKIAETRTLGAFLAFAENR